MLPRTRAPTSTARTQGATRTRKLLGPGETRTQHSSLRRRGDRRMRGIGSNEHLCSEAINNPRFYLEK